jgi:hypothetical protein
MANVSTNKSNSYTTSAVPRLVETVRRDFTRIQTRIYILNNPEESIQIALVFSQKITKQDITQHQTRISTTRTIFVVSKIDFSLRRAQNTNRVCKTGA